MQRHASAPFCRKRGRTGGFLYRSLRIGRYLGLILAALFSTLFFQALLSLFKSRIAGNDAYPIQKGDLVVVDGLSWKQEMTPPHISRAVQSGERSGDFELTKKLWKRPPNRGYEPCIFLQKSYKGLKVSRGYLLVHANGGLNQMRAGICDMVAVAHIINATLVIPELDKRSFWRDSSNFSDVFDEDYFIKALERDVLVVKKLPKELLSTKKAHKQFRSWSGIKYYQDEIAQLWKEYKVIHAVKSDSRLANNNLPLDIQKLRCRVHYDALRFAPPIEALGKKLVERMRSTGPYIALHLRYEKDILAFSGCSYDLSEGETEELTAIRENTPHWKVKNINSTDQRLKGLCPLTPREVGIFLRALGYPSTTRLYIAAGEIYGGNSSMAGLEAYFPNLMHKEVIATSEELRPFSNYASQMAALDYIMCVESDVFVPSYSGNMARAVEGHRRYLGHRKTIIPDRRQLVGLFNHLDQGVLEEGVYFSSMVTETHSKRQGAPRKRRGPLPGSKGRERFRTEEAFYNNPLPECLCQKHSSSLYLQKPSIQKAGGRISYQTRSGRARKNFQALTHL